MGNIIPKSHSRHRGTIQSLYLRSYAIHVDYNNVLCLFYVMLYISIIYLIKKYAKSRGFKNYSVK